VITNFTAIFTSSKYRHNVHEGAYFNHSCFDFCCVLKKVD
jgi:hypothetical protein